MDRDSIMTTAMVEEGIMDTIIMLLNKTWVVIGIMEAGCRPLLRT